MAGKPFDNLTEVYETLVDWPKRLANEERFFRRWFERAGVRRVVDVACGTGQHAAMFHDWGLRVEGADISPNMIARARARFGEPDGLRWVVRGFDEPIRTSEPFDAAVCGGNSLSLAPDMATVQRAVGEMFAAVRPGGLVLVHVLNLWRMPDGPCVWQKCLRATLGQVDVLVLKGVHRRESRGYVDLIVMDPSGGAPLVGESVPFLGLEAGDLEEMARQAGAGQIGVFGGYQDQTYERHESVDLIGCFLKRR